MRHNPNRGKEVIESNNQYTTTLQTDDNTLFSETVFHDKNVLQRTHDLRNHEVFKNSKMSLHDNEDVRAVITCPDTLQWQLFKTAEPETYLLLKSPDEADRMKAVKRIEILKPEWLVYTRI